MYINRITGIEAQSKKMKSMKANTRNNNTFLPSRVLKPDIFNENKDSLEIMSHDTRRIDPDKIQGFSTKSEIE